MQEDEDFSNSALYQTALEEQISAPTRKPINPENLKWAQGPPRHRTGSSNPDRGLGSSVELIGGHVCATMLPTVNSVGERDRLVLETKFYLIKNIFILCFFLNKNALTIKFIFIKNS